MKLYGSRCSYFTGKLENYFRVKGLPYEFHSMQFPQDERRFKELLGLSQMPVLQLDDGRWMTDSTCIIQWFEQQHPQPALIPDDPLQAFVCRLLEDYADEWLWRPAMHYRWHYPEGAQLLSRLLVQECTASVPLPAFVKHRLLRYRQRSGYTRGDGIDATAVEGVEQIYLRTLDQLQAIFEKRRFLLSDKPSLADIGFSGPFFRHFGLDPVPLEIMRQRAPAVLAWVSRLWNSRPEDCEPNWTSGIPEDLGPLLNEIGQCYLPYLCANADAVAAGEKRFDVEVGGVHYRRARYSGYRVWCLAELRRHVQELPEADQQAAQDLLQSHDCWEPLWRTPNLPLLPNQEQGLPFRATTKMVGVYN